MQESVVILDKDTISGSEFIPFVDVSCLKFDIADGLLERIGGWSEISRYEGLTL